MADDTTTTEIPDFDGDELDFEVDLTMADFKGGWFTLEIVDTNVTKQVNPRYPKPSYSALIKFRIVDDEDFEDQAVSTFLALSSNGIAAVKKKAAFVNALNGGPVGERKVNLTMAKEFTTEGSERVILKGLKGERVGAYVVVKGSFLNIDEDKFVPVDQVEMNQVGSDDDPFE